MTAALRAVLRSPLWLASVVLASCAVVLALVPARLFVVPGALAQNPVDVAYAQHHCAPTPAGGPLLLITTGAGPGLIVAATSVDGRAAERDWLTDERGAVYGWCRA